MAPSLTKKQFDPSATSDELRQQWIHPSDIFVVLLILGGDVIERALAQLAGTGYGLTPVTFSFGWVAYSVSALMAAMGENKLMPSDPDSKCKVINGNSGYVRDNTSWILGRISRDYNNWMHPATKHRTEEILAEKWHDLRRQNPDAERPLRAGLVVAVYQPSDCQPTGMARRDGIFWSGLVVIVLQLGLAAVPMGLDGEWGVLSVTGAGIALALATGALPQWKKEKYACRRGAADTYVLTRGNGTQHAIVVLGNRRGFNLEDLAAGQSNVDTEANMATRVALATLSALWIVLLITATGLERQSWFLLAVGGLGIVQNVFAAGWPRRPENFGIPLDFVAVYAGAKVMDTLFALEEKYPRLGRSMRDEFFPGTLRPPELERWDELQKRADAGKT